MKPILRFFLVLITACLSSCVVPYTTTVSSGWDDPVASTVVVGGVTRGMAGYYGGGYGRGYYGRPYYGAGAGYVGRSIARGYHRPYVGARPGRF